MPESLKALPSQPLHKGELLPKRTQESELLPFPKMDVLVAVNEAVWHPAVEGRFAWQAIGLAATMHPLSNVPSDQAGAEDVQSAA
jgi:hypothetical protein